LSILKNQANAFTMTPIEKEILERRRELLKRASEQNVLIIEDDYESELKFSGQQFQR